MNVAQLTVELDTIVNPTSIAVIDNADNLRAFINYAKENLTTEQMAEVKSRFQFNIIPMAISAPDDIDTHVDNFKASAVETVVAAVAKEMDVSILEAITLMQASAAKRAKITNDESVLDSLCAYKSKLIDEMMQNDEL